MQNNEEFEMDKLTDDEKKLAELISQMTDEEFEEMEKFVEAFIDKREKE